MNNIQIKHKMAFGILLPLSLLICICILAINMMNNIEKGVVTIYNDRVVPLEDLKVIADDYAVFVIDAINKANAGEFSAEQANQALQEASNNIDSKWRQYVATELTTDEKRLVDEAERLFVPANQRITHLEQLLGGKSGNIAGQLREEIIPLYRVIDPISGTIAELISLQLKVAGEEKDRVAEIYESSISLFILITLVAAIASIVLGVWINRSVMKPINHIRTQLHTIQQDSDLTVTFEQLNKDELGLISTGLNDVFRHLRGILKGVAEAANSVSDSALALNEFTQISNARIQQQQAETEQTATAMNEMTATVNEVAQSTTAAADSARNADRFAANGNDIVQLSISSMQALSMQIQSTSEVITHLSHESQHIGSVLSVIKGIAEQTNLLALNAAIEAARAGEQGRGFAVVADEVRSLAQRTQEATQEIETMIETLQSGVNEAVTAMDVGIKQVDDANQQTNKAGEALQEIVASVDNITEMNTHIATAAEEQSSVAESINRSIIAISDIASQSTESALELGHSIAQLTSLADSMRQQVTTFRL
ncbi:methyl-accepting chemotaxis protein [Shewanella loihica]|uniref:Methyl-accepting chemotaxis sensory transducer n=1 Tax=Shewanella loihica (strain ATCC BAA-1088 / PV-4) TaxID=323850 RepID=A3QH70_SHELP|nr:MULTISPECIES: methyl-accepting chemotaxis protein [Shewanella]ABO24818.1 methyl-accepting chemotaxis sensory transducer [Shewanella loihica PV-4]QYJ81618.1 methyl-accepting chemotaxis protein [Shewanella aegiceratis]